MLIQIWAVVKCFWNAGWTPSACRLKELFRIFLLIRQKFIHHFNWTIFQKEFLRWENKCGSEQSQSSHFVNIFQRDPHKITYNVKSTYIKLLNSFTIAFLFPIFFLLKNHKRLCILNNFKKFSNSMWMQKKSFVIKLHFKVESSLKSFIFENF